MVSGIGFYLFLPHLSYHSLNSRSGLNPSGEATDHAYQHLQGYHPSRNQMNRVRIKVTNEIIKNPEKRNKGRECNIRVQ